MKALWAFYTNSVQQEVLERQGCQYLMILRSGDRLNVARTAEFSKVLCPAFADTIIFF